MSRIVPQILTLSQHLISLAEAPQIYRPARCPSCGLGGRLWGHGSYERKANRDRDPAVPDFLPIPRFYCRHCGKTCSRLPECLPPRRWYQWKIQQVLLYCLLAGGSMRYASSLIGVGRSTGRRWWNWLKGQSDRFAFYLKDRFPDLGRTLDRRHFWITYFKGGSLSFAMVILDQAGVEVP